MIPGSPHPFSAPRPIIGTLMGKPWSPLVTVPSLSPCPSIPYNINHLKDGRQGGPGGQGKFSPITHARPRARACFYFMYLNFFFLKKNTDHKDQTSKGGGFNSDRSPRPAMTHPDHNQKEKNQMDKTAFDHLNDKYGFVPTQDTTDQTPAVGTEIQELTNWKDSELVTMLSAFLKEYHDQGFALQVTRQGQPILSFDPGLKTEAHDPERWDLAAHASYLLTEARADLEYLIQYDLIKLPQNSLI